MCMARELSQFGLDPSGRYVGRPQYAAALSGECRLFLAHTRQGEVTFGA